jgi:hypothetical protein
VDIGRFYHEIWYLAFGAGLKDLTNAQQLIPVLAKVITKKRATAFDASPL